jgi:hypothetical protein
MAMAGAAMVLALGLVGGGWWFVFRVPTPNPSVIGSAATAAQNQPSQPTVAAGGPPPSPVTPQPPSSIAQPTPSADVPAPPPQDNPQLAMAGLEPLRHQVAQWVSSRGCAILSGDVADGGSVQLNGLAGVRSVEDLRQGLASFVPPGRIDWGVTGVDPVFCPALNALRPITPAFAASDGPHLGLRMADGKTRLHDGNQIGVALVMPDFTSRLRVDYVAHDGSVQHLYPQLAEPDHGIVADPPRTWPPGAPVNLTHPSWLIGTPYGTDMIIAVASSEPLFDRPRPKNAEAADAYLPALQTAIDDLRQRGARLAGAAVTLDALP